MAGLKASRETRHIVRGFAAVVSRFVDSPAERRAIIQAGERLAGALKDGLSIQLRTTGDEIGIGVVRHRKPRTIQAKARVIK